MYNQEQPVSEFELTQADFEKFSRLVYEQSGISLHDGKKELIKARLSKRVRQGRFKSFRDYYQYVVQDDSGEELVFLLDSISTNLTSFFREQSHFDYLKNELLPRWNSGPERLGTRKFASGAPVAPPGKRSIPFPSPCWRGWSIRKNGKSKSWPRTSPPRC